MKKMKQNDTVKGTLWGHIWVIREGFCKEVTCEPKGKREPVIQQSGKEHSRKSELSMPKPQGETRLDYPGDPRKPLWLECGG